MWNRYLQNCSFMTSRIWFHLFKQWGKCMFRNIIRYQRCQRKGNGLSDMEACFWIIFPCPKIVNEIQYSVTENSITQNTHPHTQDLKLGRLCVPEPWSCFMSPEHCVFSCGFVWGVRYDIPLLYHFQLSSKSSYFIYIFSYIYLSDAIYCVYLIYSWIGKVNSPT